MKVTVEDDGTVYRVLINGKLAVEIMNEQILTANESMERELEQLRPFKMLADKIIALLTHMAVLRSEPQFASFHEGFIEGYYKQTVPFREAAHGSLVTIKGALFRDCDYRNGYDYGESLRMIKQYCKTFSELHNLKSAHVNGAHFVPVEEAQQ